MVNTFSVFFNLPLFSQRDSLTQSWGRLWLAWPKWRPTAQRSLARDQWLETQGPLGFNVVEISWLLGSSPFLSSDKLCKGREEDVKNELGATAQLQVTRLTPARHLVIVHSCSRRSICSLLQNGRLWTVYLDASLMCPCVRVFLQLSSPMLTVTLEESYLASFRDDKIEARGSEI